MTKMTFSSETTNPDGRVTSFCMTTDAVTLPEILENFELFLKGSGFVFDGNVDIVEESK